MKNMERNIEKGGSRECSSLTLIICEREAPCEGVPGRGLCSKGNSRPVDPDFAGWTEHASSFRGNES